MWLLLSFWRHTSYVPQAWFAQLPAIVWKLEGKLFYRFDNICIFELHLVYTTYLANSYAFHCKWLRSLFPCGSVFVKLNSTKKLLHRIVLHNRRRPCHSTFYDHSWSVTNNIPAIFFFFCDFVAWQQNRLRE